MSPRRWCIAASDPQVVDRLASDLGLPPIVARILVNRGVHDAESASRFLDPRLDHLHDPMRLADMPRAVDRIRRALAGGERIAIHGDYDVDGVISTVMLRRALEMLGGKVVHVLPERIRDGYGLGVGAVERVHADGASLLISVDCGIRAAAAARRASDLGLDLIVADHHEPEAELPHAVAVLNPKRLDCSYPDKELAGAGVTFKLVQALCELSGHADWVKHFLKMAAIGTIADVVPLTGENRVLARLGLQALSEAGHKVGLRALLEESSLLGRTLDSYHVSFVLAPRLNAAGRMATPDLAARLLLLTDEARIDEARALARRLSEENARRQEEERAILEAAKTSIQRDPAIGSHHVIVVGGEGWHRGVIGIVASKLVDAFNKPAVVLAIDDDLAHGSCRSIPEFDILDALERCADLFERFGGHRQAAGLTIRTDRIEALRSRLAQWALEMIRPEDLIPRVRIDGELPLAAVTPDVLAALDRLAPFGPGNPTPVFTSGAAEVASGPRILKQRHLDLSLRQGPRTYRAVMWRGAELLDTISAHRQAIEVAYSLERNSFRGESTVELRIVAVRPPIVIPLADAQPAAIA